MGLNNTMDIPTHILEAVQANDASSQRHLDADSIRSRQKSPLAPAFNDSVHNAHSSAEDLSTTSDSGNERDYQTDFTTPESSESCPEDMQPDDVEDFRDREYPQLKGKTYLDHGGTTVCGTPIGSGKMRKISPLTCSSSFTQSPWSKNSPQI